MTQKRIVKFNRTGELGTLLQASESEEGKTHFYPANAEPMQDSTVSANCL